MPDTGRPKSLPASTLEVDAQPPTTAARLAHTPPAAPCARRRPNSATGDWAARHTRAAFVAMSVWKFTQFKSAVSMSWQSAMGPVTRTMGSCGNTTVPSGTASTSTESRNVRKCSRNAGLNKGPPPGASREER